MNKFTLALGLAALSALGLSESIYTDSLQNNWQNWSWANVSFTNTSPVHSGKDSISVTETGSYQALYLHHSAQWTTGYHAIQFWINGGSTGGQSQLAVQATLNGGAQATYFLPPLPKNQWVEVTVPLLGVGAGSVNIFDGFWIIDDSGNTQAEYFVDDINLTDAPGPATSETIYADALANGWKNASTAAANFASTWHPQSGTDSISVTSIHPTDNFSLVHGPVDGTQYQTLDFWVNGGPQGGQELQLNALSSGTPQVTYPLPTLPKNSWVEFRVPLLTLGVSARGDFDGFTLSNRAATVPSVYYLDGIELNVNPPPANKLATISVTTATKTPISPFIYGVNSTDWAHMGTGFGLSRQGGNRLTAYNWENNASNAGSDYTFQNDDTMGSSNTAGWTGKTFIAQALSGNAMPLLTIQMMGYVAADKNPPGNVNQTANYLTVRMRQTAPAKPGGNFIYPPNNTGQYTVYQDEFVHYIKQFASPNAPLMFDLDNEPDLWGGNVNATWYEMHPNGATYAEELTDSINYSTALKKVYPQGLVFGPVSYGWAGYQNFQGASDANGRNFLAFYLAGMASASKTAKTRLLDTLDLHWYPEATGDNVRIAGEGDSPGEAASRIQAARSLYDSGYVEDSWITQSSTGGKGIDLIPYVEDLIYKNYDGTKLSFSEYNYGGGNAISGAIAQADVLGVFGRYGVFAAANWGLSSTEISELAGFKSFINYDRAGSRFGDLELKVTGQNNAIDSIFAALDSTNAKRMTLVVINKTIATSPFTIDLTGFTVNSSKAYTVTAGHYTTPLTTSITNLSDAISFNAPPMSITTIELLSK